MRQRISSILLFAGFFLLHSSQSPAQAFSDWIWNTPSFLTSAPYQLAQAPDGAVWSVAGTQVLRFDGSAWQVYDYTNAGITLASKYLRSIALAPNGRVWCGTIDRVLELDPANNSWTLHNPSNSKVNLNGFDITIDAAGHIYWMTASGYYEYNGSSWSLHWFYKPGLNSIQEGDYRQLLINPANEKWFLTPGSICFEGGCFTPAGLMFYNGQDTIAYDGASLGFAQDIILYMTANSQHQPLILANRYLPGGVVSKPVFRSFLNNSWQTAVQVPVSLAVAAFDMDQAGRLWLAGKDPAGAPLLVRGNTDGTWTTIPMDPARITDVYSLLVDDAGQVWVGGLNKNAAVPGRLGLLPQSNYKAKGLVYLDANNNGLSDPGEAGFPYGILEITPPGQQYEMTDAQGEYSAALYSAGTYNAQLSVPGYTTPTVPATGQQTFSVSGGLPVAAGLNFGLSPQTDKTDLALYLTAFQPPRPGFPVCYQLDFKNLAPQAANGSLTVSFDNHLVFQSSSVQPDATPGPNTFTFSFTGLKWLETRSIQFCFTLPDDVNLIGTELYHTGEIIPAQGADANLANNSLQFTHRVVGAYDPNTKEVEPRGVGLGGRIPLDVPFLDYTIHFQNTGTAAATVVAVTDSLDGDFDLSSFRMIAASHPYRLELYNERVLRWTFDNINLPHSGSDAQGSNGFVRFTLRPRDGSGAGTILSNFSDIYFDYNPPVRTNTVRNTLWPGKPAGPRSAPECAWSLHLAGDELIVDGENLPTAFCLTDALGRRVRSFELSGAARFDLSGLPAGVYVAVPAEGGKCRFAGQKIVKG